MARGPGAAVHAGTVNVGATTLLIRTTAAAGDTAVARMAALVEQARGSGCGGDWEMGTESGGCRGWLWERSGAAAPLPPHLALYPCAAPCPARRRPASRARQRRWWQRCGAGRRQHACCCACMQPCMHAAIRPWQDPPCLPLPCASPLPASARPTHQSTCAQPPRSLAAPIHLTRHTQPRPATRHIACS